MPLGEPGRRKRGSGGGGTDGSHASACACAHRMPAPGARWGPCRACLSGHWRRSAHAGTRRAQPSWTRDKGAPFDGVPSVQVPSKFRGSLPVSWDHRGSRATPPLRRKSALTRSTDGLAWAGVITSSQPGPIRSPTLYPTELQAHQALTIHRPLRRPGRITCAVTSSTADATSRSTAA